MRLFLDTGPLVAAVHRRDRRHGDAKRLLQTIADGAWKQVHTNDLVLVEAVNFIVARVGVRASLQALAKLMTGDDAIVSHVHHVDAGAQASAFAAVLKRFDGLSLTNRTILDSMERHRIDELATYDRGFEGRVPIIHVQALG